MIDVRKWGRTKTIFKEAKVNKSWWGAGRVGEWECEEPEMIQEGKLDQVKWIFKANDGSVKRTEFIKLTARSTPHTDSFAALLDLLEPTPTPAPIVKSTIAPLAVVEIEKSAESLPLERPRSASPPPYLSIPTKSLMYNEDDTFALLVATQDAEQMKDSIQQEMNVGMKLLKSLIGDAETVISTRKEISRPAVEGFGDESDDAEEVLRLRGGGGEEEEEESSSDEDEVDSEMVVVEKPKTILQMGDLKDMFKPQEAAGTFLFYSNRCNTD